MCIVICTLLLSRPARGAWVEINKGLIYSNMGIGSRPARGAWVEIVGLLLIAPVLLVAPRKGRVG